MAERRGMSTAEVVLLLAGGALGGGFALASGYTVWKRRHPDPLPTAVVARTRGSDAAARSEEWLGEAEAAAKDAQTAMAMGGNPTRSIAHAWAMFGRALGRRLGPDVTTTPAMQAAEARTAALIRDVTNAAATKRLI